MLPTCRSALDDDEKHQKKITIFFGQASTVIEVVWKNLHSVEKSKKEDARTDKDQHYIKSFVAAKGLSD